MMDRMGGRNIPLIMYILSKKLTLAVWKADSFLMERRSNMR